jgi:hypothetical protein
MVRSLPSQRKQELSQAWFGFEQVGGANGNTPNAKTDLDWIILCARVGPTRSSILSVLACDDVCV